MTKHFKLLFSFHQNCEYKNLSLATWNSIHIKLQNVNWSIVFFIDINRSYSLCRWHNEKAVLGGLLRWIPAFLFPLLQTSWSDITCRKMDWLWNTVIRISFYIFCYIISFKWMQTYHTCVFSKFENTISIDSKTCLLLVPFAVIYCKRPVHLAIVLYHNTSQMKPGIV